MGDPSNPSTEMEDELDAEKGDNSLPGGDQADSEKAFEAVVDDEAKANG